jgi:hypothetical protein
MSRLANLGMVFTSPSSVARNVLQDPHWVLPLVVVLVVSFLASAATYEYQVKAQREYAEEIIRERDPDADIDAMFAVNPVRRVVGGAIAVAITGVVLLIIAAVLKGVASVAGGSVRFGAMFSFTCYSAVISALGSLVKTALIIMKGNLDVRTSLAAAAPSLTMRSPQFAFLDRFDIFAIWWVVALCFGLSVLSGLGIKKSAGIVVALWAVYVVIRVLLAMLGTMFGAA